ncbi:16S rRNA (uracil1498-N3)-methyltransferase [Ligilactobacillus sp. WC1T17]|uniref:Ribosomal RNA small subunit methyltransferase E n=1 Tax=Ligilactobacillus ruminis TaxID=1623 RepID=A0ABY1ABI4_9LACO|nr:16S rRNA (uracil1498-N3)-methyltransferase [Ligilactobacillus ruminis]
MQRYFLNEDLKAQNPLPNEIYRHAIVVMRMKVGERFELVTPDELVHVVEISQLENKKAFVKEVEVLKPVVELPVRAHLFCGLSKKDKAEWVVQKATELGADTITFFKGDWSVAKWDEKKQVKKLERLAKIAQGAAEQSHRVHIPQIKFMENLNQLDLPLATVGLCAYEEAAKEGEKSSMAKAMQLLKKDAKEVYAVFGPEGGLSPKETDLLKQKGFLMAGLGPRIMRTETAPLYFLAALSFALELE